MDELCTKTGLIRLLRRFYKHSFDPCISNYTVHDSVPPTYVVMANCQDVEYAAFVQHFNLLQAQHVERDKVPLKHCIDNMWLIKPAAQNQGSVLG